MSTAKGRSGEELATRYLACKGHEIIGCNLRLGRGEIDIVARFESLLLFVEVKSHQSRQSGLLAVNRDKCEGLYSAAESWLAKHPQYSDLQCRFDLIIVTPRIGLLGWVPPSIEHMKDIING